MKRPRSLVLAALVGGLLGSAVLSSCATLDNANVAARLGDATITDEQVAAVANSPLANGSFDATTVDGDLARRIIAVWIRGQAMRGNPALASLDDATLRQSLVSELGEVFETSDPFAQQLVIDASRVSQAINQGLISETDAVAAVSLTSPEVNARYGAWDPVTVDVVALSS